MAYHIIENGIKYTFMDYILSESIRPVLTPFGTNEEANNSQFIRFDDPTEDIATLFKENDNSYFMVTIRLDNGEILLEHGMKYSLDPSDFSMNRYKTQNALLSFGKTMYVALLLITKIGLTKFCFMESDPGLGSVYKRLTQNTFFLQDLAQLGFGYAGEKNGYHIFKKVFNK